MIQRIVRWQLAKKQQGGHKTSAVPRWPAPAPRCSSRRERAAPVTLRAPQFRGGGKAHGPVIRSHAHDLPKKVRALALRHALSAKAMSSDSSLSTTCPLPRPRPRR
jgi:large subunit ribosomal protein L4